MVRIHWCRSCGVFAFGYGNDNDVDDAAVDVDGAVYVGWRADVVEAANASSHTTVRDRDRSKP